MMQKTRKWFYKHEVAKICGNKSKFVGGNMCFPCKCRGFFHSSAAVEWMECEMGAEVSVSCFFSRSYENIFCQKVRATMKNSRQRILMKCYFIDVNTQCEMNNTTHRRLYIRLQSLLSLTMPKSYSSFLHTLQCVIYVLNMNIAEHEHATQHRTCSAFCYFVSAHNLTHLRLHRSYFKFF